MTKNSGVAEEGIKIHPVQDELTRIEKGEFQLDRVRLRKAPAIKFGRRCRRPLPNDILVAEAVFVD